jgi:uncharacterized membrane protein
MIGETVSTTIPYALSATIVLLPLAFVSDFFYRKHEPLRKNEAAMVIMVLHAVLFALAGIGSLITAVFTGLNSIINPSDDSALVTRVIVIAATVTTLLFAVTFLRILNPFKQKIGAKVYALFMLAGTIALLAFAILGPVAESVTTRNDRQLESSLSTVSYSIETYTTLHGELPNDLSDLTFYSDATAKALIKEGKIEYIAGEEQAASSEAYPSFRYQLCVHYDRKAQATGYLFNGENTDDDGYGPSLSATPHDAGRICYKLYT